MSKQTSENSSQEAGRQPVQQGLIIRPATVDDAARIAAISAAVNIRAFAPLGQGFLVYTLEESEYRRRIEDGQYVFVFEFDRKVAGFVCGYSPETLAAYLSDGTLAHESSIGRQVLQTAMKGANTHYAFLDSIAVAPEFQQQGLGEHAFVAVCEAISLPFYVAMLEAPIRNPRIDYWQRRGFVRVNEILQATSERFRLVAPSQEDVPYLRWGIYILPRGGFTPQRIRRAGGQESHE